MCIEIIHVCVCDLFSSVCDRQETKLAMAHRPALFAGGCSAHRLAVGGVCNAL